MNWYILLRLALMLTKGALAAATNAKAPQEIIDGLQAALDAHEAVHGLPVTKAQLEQLNVDAPFGG